MKCDDQTSINSRHEHLNHEQHQHSQEHECSVHIILLSVWSFTARIDATDKTFVNGNL